MLAGVLLYEFELVAQQKTIQRVVVGVDKYRAHLEELKVWRRLASATVCGKLQAPFLPTMQTLSTQ